MSFQKTIIYLALLLDIIGISVMIPAFPELKLYYGISDFAVTMGLTVYSLFAFLAAPVLGQLSDKYGRKVPLLRCVIGTLFSYLILLVSQNYILFLASRVINGITGGNISILQAILADISPTPEEKAKNFWLMGAFFGLGFIIGPVLGAMLLKFGGVHGIFWAGTIFAVIEIVLIAMQFKNTNTADHDKHLDYNSFIIMIKYFKKDHIRQLLISLAFLGIGGFIVNASMGLYMQGLFNTSGSQYGLYLGIAGVIGALNMGYLIPKFWLKKFHTDTVNVINHLSLIIWYFLVGLSSNEFAFIILFYLTILFGNAYFVIYNRKIMSYAQPNEIGEVSGMLGGLQSVFMFIWPLIGWLLLNYHINIFRATVVFTILSGVVMLREFRGR